MKYLILVILTVFVAGCGDKSYTEKELAKYKKTVDCDGYPNEKKFSDVKNKQLRKASIQKCEHQLFLNTDNIKPSPKKEY